MKVLGIGVMAHPSFAHKMTASTLGDSSPFGYDLIIVDPNPRVNILGNGHNRDIEWARWRTSLSKWMNENHRVIVIIRPDDNSGSYNWLPLSNFASSRMQAVGINSYIGDVIAPDIYVKNFLNSNKDSFSVVAHYINDTEAENIIPGSRVDPTLLTSFTYREASMEVIFLPPTSLLNLNSIVSALDASSNRWKISNISELESRLSVLNSQMAELEQDHYKLEQDLLSLNQTVDSIVSGDVYLSRSIRHFEQTQGVEKPNPEDFYEAIEAIEKVFSSEREMRDTLGFSKNYIDAITKRTNEFRHVARSGEPPVELTAEEITGFTQKTHEVITSYIKYLFDKEK